MKKKNTNFNIPIEGSLGLLALGDLGLDAWRKVKLEKSQKKSKKNNEK